MKQKLLSLSFLVLFFFAGAQEVPQKILVEHFTNTYCGTCANRNPSFYNTIAPYTKAVHIAYHPSSPYSSCPFNQHNTSENDGRTNYYGIYGSTPRVVLNGMVLPSSNNLITTAQMDGENSKTSPFSISINQDQVGNDSMFASISISTVSATTVSNANLVVVLSEKEVDFSAQNGENRHYDVFRKYLANISITLPSNGSDTIIYVGSIIDQEWNGSEITTTAILQESNQNVLQAEQSDKLDFTTGISLKTIIEEVLYPNPAKDFLYIDNSSQLIEKIEIYNIIGSLVGRIDLEQQKLAKLFVADYEKGSYIVRIYDKDQQVYTRKIVVDY